MNLYQYFNAEEGFKFDMDQFLEQISPSDREHLGSPFSFQEIFLTRKNLSFIFGTERFCMFITALYYSLVFQAVIRKHFPDFESSIPKSSIFPGFYGPCDSFCRDRWSAYDILPAKRADEYEEMRKYILRTKSDMELLTHRFLEEFMIGVDFQVFWMRIVEEMNYLN